ncbi:hypothetical protein [Poseidonocella sp. HB161398]|uniref:hypothetical protein n=1 Tax=Poseidonocella sp. HB161398 TaxID=2320855 RepID=UPI001109AE6C|nr:hypothetical protein [Poseidonocella sp. HB161398]
MFFFVVGTAPAGGRDGTCEDQQLADRAAGGIARHRRAASSGEVRLWTESLYKIDPALAAAATVMLPIVVLLVTLAGLLQIRSRRRA